MMEHYKIIDTPWNTSSKVDCLFNAGIRTVIRYYNNGNSHVLYQKQLEKPEAQALSNAGINIMVIFETTNNNASYFSKERGQEDGKNAYIWAKNTIGQPTGSAIYFAVDYDALQYDLAHHIIPYFQGIHEAFNDLSSDSPLYLVGAYGSGAVVTTLKSKDLCEYRWVSKSPDYWGTKKAIINHAYELYQAQIPASKTCDIPVDYDVQNINVHDIGSFKL